MDKACRQYLGRTVSEEIRRIRLAKAIELLRPGGGRPKIAAIARQCGYSSATHLRDTLLRATGSTPVRFWKEMSTPHTNAVRKRAAGMTRMPVALST